MRPGHVLPWLFSISTFAVGTVSSLGRPGMDARAALLLHVVVVLLQFAFLGLLPALFAFSLTIWIRHRHVGIQYGSPLQAIAVGGDGLLSMFLASIFPSGLWSLCMLGTMGCSTVGDLSGLSRPHAEADPVAPPVMRRFRTCANWSGSLSLGLIILGLLSSSFGTKLRTTNRTLDCRRGNARAVPFKMSRHPDANAARIFSEVGQPLCPQGRVLFPEIYFRGQMSVRRSCNHPSS